jgi:hypothetical protein
VTAPTNIFSNNVSFFTDPTAGQAQMDLMSLQAQKNVPQNNGAFTLISDPLLPDRNLTDRLGHFDPELYDLRDTSHLMKLLRSLLGGAGAGGLRKQIAVARLQNSFRTTHFLDLDRFYGALFGVVRTKAEVMPDYGTLVTAAPITAPIYYNLHSSAHFTTGTVAPGQFALGEEFEVVNPVQLASLRYWRQSSAVTGGLGAIFRVSDGTEVPGTRVGFTNPPASSLPAWHSADVPVSTVLDPGRYKVVVTFTGSFYFQNGFFTTGGGASSLTAGPARLLSKADATGTAQGTYIASADGSMKYPTSYDANAATWGLDVTYTDVVSSTTDVVGGKFDPYTDAAGSDVWDDIHSRDASYRARITKFARAIPQGGTYAGILAAVEAILSADCEMYESWSWIDEIGGASTISTKYTYAQLERNFKNWSGIATNRTWSQLTGEVVSIGRLSQPNRGEIVLKPKRTVTEDERYELMRVLQRLAPAGVQFTVDPQGIALHEKQDIRNVAASSEYWEVMNQTLPAPVTIESNSTVAQQPSQQPRPAFSQYTGEKWSYNNDVATISSYEMTGDTALTSTDYDEVIYADGTSHKYLPSDGLVPGQEAAAARLTADGVCTSKPYVPMRNPSISISANLAVTLGRILNIRAGVMVGRR